MNKIQANVVLKDGTVKDHNVNYVKFINEDTYGTPDLIADEQVKDEGLPVRILYVNVNGVAAVVAERTE